MHLSQWQDRRAEELRTARRLGPRIVAVGGGTGLSTMLRGLKEASENITVVVTVADDGGGSGMLREDLRMLPPGDIRNCMLALANTEPTLYELLNYRFSEGSLSGQSFGNLFLAALNGICGSFDRAVARMNEVLAVTGRVLPVSTADVYLEAEFENGATVLGESKIFAAKKKQNSRIRRVRLIPEHPAPLPAAVEAIRDAELILLGPGSLYTSVIPNLLVSGISDAIAGSPALKMYVCNVMTQEGETEGYTAFDHVRELLAHTRPDLVDICLVNNAPLPDALRGAYEAEGAGPTVIDRARFTQTGIELVERPLLRFDAGYARHDPLRLTYEIMEILRERRPRAELYGECDKLMLLSLREQLLSI